MGTDVSLEGVSRWYARDGATRTVALDDVTFHVPAGSVTAFMGPSGSGKSTLLHVIGAMDRADQGTIRVGDEDITRLSQRDQAVYRRTIGFVFQSFHLLGALTALENVLAPVLPRATDFNKVERATELIDAVGLRGKEASRPAQLSGGEQQRVAIARALVNDPQLLLADEPTGNLDTTAGAEIMDLTLGLRESRGMTVVIATHDPLIATRCDRIVRLRDGRVVEELDVSGDGTQEVLGRITRLGPI